MGAAGSIETTPYDEAKFLQSKAIMESAAEDADKFAKLKSIWADGAPPAAAAAAPAADAAPAAADAHQKSVKELPTAEVAATHEGHKENGHAHGEDGHAHKEGDHHHKEDGHAHKEGDHHHKEEAHAHHDHAHKDGEHHGEHHHKDDHHEHKKEETHAHKEEAHKEEAHAPKEDGHAEAPKEAPKVPSASASTSKLPGNPSEHHDEKLSKEA